MSSLFEYFVSAEATRWWIDVNRDREGLQVLVDLQGGNPDDPVATTVFEEIKDTVMTEVRRSPH